MKYFMVLNDGETYTNLDGCKIVSLPDYVDGDNAAKFIENGEGRIEWTFVESYGGMGMVQSFPDDEMDDKVIIDEHITNLQAEKWLRDNPDFGK